MTDDLIARLRSENATLGDDINGYEPPRIQLEAADALEAKDSEIRILRSMIRGDALQTDRLLAVNEAFDAEIEAQARRIAELEAALDSVLIGGNHLALLIGADHPLHTASHEEAMSHYGSRDIYEIWCCWRTMMNAGPVLAARAAYLGEKE